MAPKKAALSFLWKKEPASKDAVARKGSVARKDSTAIGAPGKTKKKITPREIWRRVKAFFQSPTGAYAGIMLSMLLFVAALGMLAMYAFEFRETLRLRLAARRVSRFMTNRDINLKKNSTREKLIAAQSYAEVLSMWTKRIKELEDEIYEIESLIVRDWDVHDNSIYYFEHKRMTFQDAVAFCATNKSFVASVEKETEEEYLEAFITTRTISFWIGLHKKGNKWVWFEDVPVTVTYWAPERPVAGIAPGPNAGNCVVIAHDCQLPKKCWEDTTCKYTRRVVCKRKLNQQLVD